MKMSHFFHRFLLLIELLKLQLRFHLISALFLLYSNFTLLVEVDFQDAILHPPLYIDYFLFCWFVPESAHLLLVEFLDLKDLPRILLQDALKLLIGLLLLFLEIDALLGQIGNQLLLLR